MFGTRPDVGGYISITTDVVECKDGKYLQIHEKYKGNQDKRFMGKQSIHLYKVDRQARVITQKTWIPDAKKQTIDIQTSDPALVQFWTPLPSEKGKRPKSVPKSVPNDPTDWEPEKEGKNVSIIDSTPAELRGGIPDGLAGSWTTAQGLAAKAGEQGKRKSFAAKIVDNISSSLRRSLKSTSK